MLLFMDRPYELSKEKEESFSIFSTVFELFRFISITYRKALRDSTVFVAVNVTACWKEELYVQKQC